MKRCSVGGLVQLPVRTTRRLARDGSSAVASLVFCPLLARSLPTELCAQCTRVESAGTETFTCRIDLPRDDGRPRVDVAEAAARTYVGELLPPETIALHETAGAHLAVALIDQGEHCVPVVSDAGRLLGVIRPRAVLWSWRDAESSPTAGAVAEATSETLAESLPLSMAMAVLAVARDAVLPVLTEAGAVVGALSAADILRWVARRMGYAVE